MIYPPKIDKDLNVDPYTDGLREVIPEKVSQLMKAMDKLQEKYDLWNIAITNCKLRNDIDEEGVYFWTLLSELEYEPYFMCQKWLAYWLNLYEKLPQVVITKRRKINEKLDVERAKEAPIEDFYDEKLRAIGTRFLGKCPFHDEHTPSFFIFRNSNTYHCFGCGANGDVIEFVQKIRGVDFVEAVRILL